jgi:hypothetical protein
MDFKRSQISIFSLELLFLLYIIFLSDLGIMKYGLFFDYLIIFNKIIRVV